MLSFFRQQSVSSLSLFVVTLSSLFFPFLASPDTMPVAASLARALSPKLPDAQPQAAASAEVEQEGEGQGSSVATCRICWCGESITVVENAENAADSRSNNNHANDASGRLVAPCSCKGTCKFVHLG